MPDERDGAPDEQTLSSLIEQVIRDVWDPLETKTILALALLGGSDTPVAEQEILGFSPLLKGARGDGSDRNSSDRLRTALQSAVSRGILLALRDDEGTLWYIIASHEARRMASSGTLHVEHDESRIPVALTLERPDIFGLYEQNIGVVSPIMADRLTEALGMYPEDWIRDAIGEAVSYNKRNWRYIQRILENWTTEGRSDETNRRDHEEHLDPEKYLRGKYATLFRRR